MKSGTKIKPGVLASLSRLLPFDLLPCGELQCDSRRKNILIIILMIENQGNFYFFPYNRLALNSQTVVQANLKKKLQKKLRKKTSRLLVSCALCNVRTFYTAAWGYILVKIKDIIFSYENMSYTDDDISSSQNLKYSGCEALCVHPAYFPRLLLVCNMLC